MTYRKKLGQRTLCVLLAIAMFLSLVPAIALAIDAEHDNPDVVAEHVELEVLDNAFDAVVASELIEETVTTEQALRDAIADTSVDVIVVDDTITLTQTIRIPNNRIVTITGEGTIQVQWTDPTQGVHFRIDRGTLTLRGNLTLTRAPGMTAHSGGVAVHGSGNATATEAVLNIYDNVRITGNSASQMLGGGVPQVARNNMGGSVWVMSGTLNMHGGEISSSFARGSGGGVFLGGSTVFNMYDGLIYDNETEMIGGGVSIGSGTFNMNGGTIDYNRADWDGGGVAIRPASGVMNMRNDAAITNNTVFDPAGGGGGVFIESTGTFNMYNGLIAGNQAYGRGGGILSMMGVINMEDGMIYDNHAHMNGGGGGGVAVLNFGPAATVNSGIFTMTGGYIAENEAQNGAGVHVWQGGRFILDGGSIVDNHSRGGGGGVFVNWDRLAAVPTNTSFTMYDGEISGNRNLNSGGGGGVLLWNQGSAIPSGTFYMHGGLIYGNEAFSNGGGINASQGNVVMYGGTIENNEAPGNGGGVAMFDGNTFTIHGGDIHDNTAQSGGGIWLGSDATLEATAGAITENHAEGDGGGIFTELFAYEALLPAGAYDNVITSEDVVFSGNTAGNGSFAPPTNWDITPIRGEGASPATAAHQVHQLNNYDVNFAQLLQIRKTAAPSSVRVNETITYTITVSNVDTVMLAEEMTVVDAIDSRLTFDPDSLEVTGVTGWTHTFTDGVLRVVLPEVPVGEVTITFDVTATAAGTIRNTAILEDENGDEVLRNDVDVVVAAPGNNGGGGDPGEDPWRQAFLIGVAAGEGQERRINPRGNITRAEIATIFFRLIEDEAREEHWMQTNPFDDVALQQWFNNAISTTHNMGLFAGVSENRFAPQQNITRGELAAVLVRFMDRDQIGQFVAPLDDTDQFNDIANHWARAYINEAARQGWVEGPQGLGGPFNPSNPLTRAEAAAMINRIFQRLIETPDCRLDDMVTWPDNQNPNSWYFLYMYMATNSYTYRFRTDNDRYKELIEIIEPRDWSVLERPFSRPEHIFGVPSV